MGKERLIVEESRPRPEGGQGLQKKQLFVEKVEKLSVLEMEELDLEETLEEMQTETDVPEQKPTKKKMAQENSPEKPKKPSAWKFLHLRVKSSKP